MPFDFNNRLPLDLRPFVINYFGLSQCVLKNSTAMVAAWHFAFGTSAQFLSRVLLGSSRCYCHFEGGIVSGLLMAIQDQMQLQRCVAPSP